MWVWYRPKNCIVCKKEFHQYEKLMTTCSHKCRGVARKVNPVESFWKKVKKTSYCWNWIGGKAKSGYGSFWDNRTQEYTNTHRFSYRLNIGEIPKGLHVLHKCDNRACVNPKHLFIGTNLDNIKDRVSKGRTVTNPKKGSNHPNAKFTDEQIKEIRREFALTKKRFGRTELAKKYSVSYGGLWRIVNHKSYK